MRKIRTIREITSAQFGGPTQMPIGTELFIYEQFTYGCISDDGVAVTVDGETPFFEIPRDSYEVVK